MNDLNIIHQGNCIDILNNDIEADSIDLIFADPPYFLQLTKPLFRPNNEIYDGVNDEWDKFSDYEEYDEFTTKWLKACKRVLKDNGSLWVIGTYHSIFRIGNILKDLDYWILNDIVWIKTNPPPNFGGTRFANAHETMFWATKSEDAKFTFNYLAMKNQNEDKQMRTDWYIPICNGNERLKIDKEKAHSTQKPEALLRRIILASTNPGDVILDPFFGTGTTGAVAKKLKRNWIGIEQDKLYCDIADERISNIEEPSEGEKKLYFTHSRRNIERVPFGLLVEVGLIKEGKTLYSKDEKYEAVVNADGSVRSGKYNFSIHKLGAKLQNIKSCNGWDFWYVKQNDNYISINSFRNEYRTKYLGYVGPDV